MDCLGADSLNDLLSDVCAEHARVIPTDTFLSLAAAELKKPIASLQLQAQRALQSLPAGIVESEEPLAQAVQAINGEAARLSELVAQLLKSRGGPSSGQELDDVPA